MTNRNSYRELFKRNYQSVSTKEEKNVNVLLVYPKFPNTFWSFSSVIDIYSSKSNTPPLGLLTVAAMLPNAWKLKLVDMNCEELLNKDIASTDMVMISAMAIQKKSCIDVISRCKSLNKKVVCGGPLFTLSHEDFPDVDHFVLDEAEITLPIFLRDLEKNKLKQVYTSTKKPYLAETPIPRWDLINFDNYLTMVVQYSRGCPFDCEFCDITVMYGRAPRTKTPEQMIQELQVLYDYGWRRSVFVVDDNFIGNKVKAKKALAQIGTWQKEHKYPFWFVTEASMNLADDQELIDLMVDANFDRVFLGIETPNPDSLEECNKLQNLNRNLTESIKVLHRNGIMVYGGFIVGFDSDTPKIFDSMIHLIQESGVVVACVGLLNAVPKTRLWHRMKKEGRLLGTIAGDNVDIALNFKPKMDRRKLIEGYIKIMNTLYSDKNYHRRIDTFVRDFKSHTKGSYGIKEVIAGIKTMWINGILSRWRFSFWRTVIKTFATNPKAIPDALELTVYSRHWQKVLERINRAKDTCEPQGEQKATSEKTQSPKITV